MRVHCRKSRIWIGQELQDFGGGAESLFLGEGVGILAGTGVDLMFADILPVWFHKDMKKSKKEDYLRWEYLIKTSFYSKKKNNLFMGTKIASNVIIVFIPTNNY